MHTTLKHLTPQQNFDLRLLIDRLVAWFSISKIVCYGRKMANIASYNSGGSWQIQEQQTLSLSLIIVLEEGADCSGAEIIKVIHNQAKPDFRARCIVYNPVLHNSPDPSSDSFVLKALQSGEVIYCNHKAAAACEGDEQSQPARLVAMYRLNPLNTAS